MFLSRRTRLMHCYLLGLPFSLQRPLFRSGPSSEHYSFSSNACKLEETEFTAVYRLINP